MFISKYGLVSQSYDEPYSEIRNEFRDESKEASKINLHDYRAVGHTHQDPLKHMHIL